MESSDGLEKENTSSSFFKTSFEKSLKLVVDFESGKRIMCLPTQRTTGFQALLLMTYFGKMLVELKRSLTISIQINCVGI